MLTEVITPRSSSTQGDMMKHYCMYFRRLVEVFVVSSLVAGCAQQGVNMVGKELDISCGWECC